jgi:predicted DNA-binding transcriptional regulator YafY
MNRVDRLMGYLLLFQSRGLMRAQDFAQQFEISERTVYRDIQALCEVGVPIMAMPGEGYRLMEGYYLPPITFSPEEARALYLAISMLAGLASPGLTQSAALAALEKVRAALPAATLRQVEALQAIINFYAFPGLALNFDDKTFLTLQEAIHQRRVVHLRYHALHTNEVTERDVEPVALVMLDKAWFLRGYCRLREDVRTFRLDRVDNLKVKPETFTFTPQPIENTPPPPGPVAVVVRFEGAIVRWVQERQHFTWAETQMAEAGRAVMIYRPQTFEQLEGWLLSWADQMEVLEPPELRARIVAVASRIANRHNLPP